MERSRFVVMAFTTILCLIELQPFQQAQAQTQTPNSPVLLNDELRQTNIIVHPFRMPNIEDQFYAKLYYSDASREPQQSSYDAFVKEITSTIGNALCLKKNVRFAASSIAMLAGRLKSQVR